MNPWRVLTKRSEVTSSHILRWVGYVFFAIGILAIGYAGYIVADAHIYQALETRKFELPIPATEPRVFVPGDVIGEIDVPRLGLNAIVVQGDTDANLRRAVGHLSNTSLPGEPGNVALAGHRETFFRPLRDVRPGDVITIKTFDAEFEYEVESTEVVLPSDIRVLQASSENSLTLVTCFPFYYVGAAPKRFIVRARQIGRPSAMGEDSHIDRVKGGNP